MIEGRRKAAFDFEKRIAGGSAPAPWVTFFARAKKVTKETRCPGAAEDPLRFSPAAALA